MTYKLIIDYVRNETYKDYKTMILQAWYYRLAGHNVQEVVSE